MAGSTHMKEVLETILARVTDDTYNMLPMTHSEVEIHRALEIMGPTKSSGPNGFNALFF